VRWPGALAACLVLAAGACRAGERPGPDPAPARAGQADAASDTAVAIFAGGCFWCMEGPFDALPGVVSTTSGYTGGSVPDPSYEQVSAGGTGHVEAVKVVYHPDQVAYRELLDVFWRNVDPLDAEGQFCDRGPTYRSAIFVQDAEQRRLAEESKRALEESARFDAPIVTAIRDAARFYPAEDYHQDYYRENPIRYRFYRAGCGRDRRLEELWGPADSAH
jgi:peptide-methionine (S)-S-oxide reductase